MGGGEYSGGGLHQHTVSKQWDHPTLLILSGLAVQYSMCSDTQGRAHVAR